MFMSSERKKRMSTGLDGTTVTVISKRKERTNWTATPVPPVDKNRFGQKILEKFGWSPGDGLGAQKQGIKEQLKPKVKSDNAGIGFKGSGEEWLKQQNDFSELLANLSGENMEVEEREISISTVKNSLELKSKKSRARVHYHKFTRGKDLSQYSSKDLAQILGPDTVYGRTSEKSSRDNVNHVNRGSMMDYFQKKDVLWDVYHKLDGERTQQTVKNKSELLLNDLPNDANNSDNIQCSGKKNRKTKNIISQREMSNSFLESSMSLVSDKQNYRKKEKKGKLISATNEDNFGNNSIFELKGNVMLVNSSNSTEKKPDSSEHDKKKRKNCKRNGINRNENSTNTDNNYLEEKDSCISSSKKKKVEKEKQLYICHTFADGWDCNNRNIEHFILSSQSSDSGIVSENSDNNFDIEKTEEEQKLSEDDSRIGDGTQYTGKKNKSKTGTQHVKEKGVSQCNGDSIGGNFGPGNKSMIQRDLYEDDNEGDFVNGIDIGVLSNIRSKKFIKRDNTSLVQGQRKMLEKLKDKNESNRRQQPFDVKAKEQVGILIRNSRYQTCESPKVNNINELYHKYVIAVHCKNNECKGSDVIDNNNARIDTEDGNMGVMRTQKGGGNMGIMRTKQSTRMTRATNKTMKERILPLSNHSRVIQKPTISHWQSVWNDWELHTVRGVNNYVKCLDKKHILEAFSNFKGASLVNIDGYPTHIQSGIGNITVSTYENERKLIAEEICTEQSEITVFSGKEQINRVGPT